MTDCVCMPSVWPCASRRHPSQCRPRGDHGTVAPDPEESHSWYVYMYACVYVKV